MRLHTPLLLLLVFAWARPEAHALQGTESAEDGFRQQLDNVVLFDADGDLGTDGDQIRVSGQFGADVFASACSSLQPPCPNLLRVLALASGSASLAVTADVSGAFEEKVFFLNPAAFVRVLFIPGPPEVALDMVFYSGYELKGELEAGARVDFGFDVLFSGRAEFDPGFSLEGTLPSASDWFSAPPELTGAASSSLTARAFVAVEFQPSVAGVPTGGPSFILGPRATLTADAQADPWWRVDASVDLLTAWGIIGAGFQLPPTLLQSLPLVGIDAGAALGDPGQFTASRWARTYDVGLFDDPTFAVPAAGDDTRTLIGVDGTSLLEVDIEGQPTNAWGWSGPSASAAVSTGAGHRLVGTTGFDGWVGDFDGAAGFSKSKRLDFSLGGVAWTPALEAIVALPGGGHVVAGYASEGFANAKRRIVARLDADGEVVWANLYGNGFLTPTFDGLELASDGNLLLLGMLANDPSLEKGVVLDKLDLDGNVLWSRRLLDDFPLGSFVHIGARMAESDGRIQLLGTRSANLATLGTDSSIWSVQIALDTGAVTRSNLLAEESNGQITLGLTNSDRISEILLDGEQMWVVGETAGDQGFEALSWTASTRGALGQVGRYDSAGVDRFEHLRRLPDGGLLSVGFSNGLAGATSNDLFLVKSGVLPLVELDPASGGVMDPAALRPFEGATSLQSTTPSEVTPIDCVVSDVTVFLFGPKAATSIDVER